MKNNVTGLNIIIANYAYDASGVAKRVDEIIDKRLRTVHHSDLKVATYIQPEITKSGLMIWQQGIRLKTLYEASQFDFVNLHLTHNLQAVPSRKTQGMFYMTERQVQDAVTLMQTGILYGNLLISEENKDLNAVSPKQIADYFYSTYPNAYGNPDNIIKNVIVVWSEYNHVQELVVPVPSRG